MNLAELAGAMNAGGMLLNLTQQADKSRQTARVEVLNGALARVDQAIEVADLAWNRSVQGQATDWRAAFELVQNQLEAARGLLRHIKLDRLIPTGVTPLGQFSPPLPPAFGPQTPGQGPFTAHTPQSFVPQTVPAAAQLRTSYEAPAMNRLRSILRAIRDRLRRVRDQYQIPAVGMGGLSGDDAPTQTGMYGRLLYFGLAAAAGYHGYKRNNGSIGSAALWAAPTLLLGNLAGLATMGVALHQGFAKPTAAAPRRNAPTPSPSSLSALQARALERAQEQKSAEADLAAAKAALAAAHAEFQRVEGRFDDDALAPYSKAIRVADGEVLRRQEALLAAMDAKLAADDAVDRAMGW